MGAWIEIPKKHEQRLSCSVAPHVGAWIEIHDMPLDSFYGVPSHPTWVRGLKYGQVYHRVLLERRTPRGCVD